MENVIGLIIVTIFIYVFVSGGFSLFIYFFKIRDNDQLTMLQQETLRQKEYIKALQESQSQLEFQLKHSTSQTIKDDDDDDDFVYDYYDFAITGTTQINESRVPRQEILKKCKKGDVIELRRERIPNYPYAIGVWTQFGRIGYIPEDENEEIAELIDEGFKIRLAKIKKITGGTEFKPRLGCVIEFEIQSP